MRLERDEDAGGRRILVTSDEAKVMEFKTPTYDVKTKE
jgi:hypothetical protein